MGLMGRMGAPPPSWSTRRGVALQTQGAMPPNDDEDGLRAGHPQGADQGQRKGHPQGVERKDTLKVLNEKDILKVLDELDTLKVLGKMDTVKASSRADTIKVLQQHYLLEKCNVLAKDVVKAM